MTARRLRQGLISYALLALLAGLTLDGNFRLLVWIILLAFAVKSIAAFKSEQMQDPPSNT